MSTPSNDDELLLRARCAQEARSTMKSTAAEEAKKVWDAASDVERILFAIAGASDRIGKVHDRVSALEERYDVRHRNVNVDQADLDSRVSSLAARVADINILLDQHVHDLRLNERVRALEIFLHGDQEARATFEKARAGNVCPNIDNPEPGFVDAVLADISNILDEVKRITEAAAAPQARLAQDVNAAIARMTRWESHAHRLEEFIPVVRSVEETVRGLKDWCESKLEALRQEHEPSRSFVQELSSAFKVPSYALRDVAYRLRELWGAEERRRDEAARPKPPSRLQALVFAITGAGGTR